MPQIQLDPYSIVLAAALGAVFIVGLLMFLLGRWSLRPAVTRMQTLEKEQQDLEDQLNDANTSLAKNEVELARIPTLLQQLEQLTERLEQATNERLRLERENASLQEQAKQGAQLQARFEHQSQENEHHQQTISRLKAELAETAARSEEERKAANEKLQLLEDAGKRLTTEFQNLANRIFDEKSKMFADSSQSQLSTLINPLKEQLGDFKKKVEDVYDKEAKDRHSLMGEIRQLKDLNQQISQDAVNLTNALKGESKTQGVWGEMVLEKVLEQSGLVKGREYETQISLKDESGSRMQPDVIIRLPEEKDIVVDAKVSLTAFERYSANDDQEERMVFAKKHCQSLRQHVKGLSEKRYEGLEGVRTLDFVLLFVPIEAAFVLAIEQDRALFTDAFEKNIVIVSPTTLLATLRTVANIWKFERQNQNAQEIAKRAGLMYDKFVRLIEELDKLGGHIDKAASSYDEVKKHISEGRGNLLNRTDALRELGAKNSKQLPDEWQQKAAIVDENSAEEG